MSNQWRTLGGSLFSDKALRADSGMFPLQTCRPSLLCQVLPFVDLARPAPEKHTKVVKSYLSSWLFSNHLLITS